MLDFLTFRWFVAPYALPVFYYLGAVGIPVAGLLMTRWVMRRFPVMQRSARMGRDAASALLTPGQRALAIAFFVVSLLLLELFWRMMFEFLVAFLQMHAALTAPLAA
jgi:hypothetical protein